MAKWNTNNVINMSGLFYHCESLKLLPDISKWNTNRVTDMRALFFLLRIINIITRYIKMEYF